MRRGYKYRGILLSIIIISLMFSGCSKAPESYESAQEPQSRDMEQDSVGFTNSEESAKFDKKTSDSDKGQNGYEGRKVIKTGQINLETREFDKTVNGIMEKTKFIGGYLEKSHVTGRGINSNGSVLNRSAHFIIRVPEKQFEDFLLDINTLGSVTDSDTGGKDITGEYFDIEARLKSLTIQEERLLEILKKAEKVEDVIELEKELSRLRYEIENLTGTLKKWDNLVSFATLDVSVYEVHEVTEVRENPRTLGNRMIDGFKDSVKILVSIFKDLLVIISSLVPFTVILVPLAILVSYIAKRKMKNNDIDKKLK